MISSKRDILSGTEYIKHFPGTNLTNQEKVVLDMGDVFDTIVEMQTVVSNSLSDTKSIAKTLKGKSLEDTCRKIWNFCYNYFQYTQDNAGVEQLRTPARSWADRKQGIDCDDYSILIASILTNLSIPCYFRMTKYNGKDYFQHIYVVVPKAPGLSLNDKANYFIIDPVVDKFNYEVPFSAKHDTKVIAPSLQGLSGIPVHVLSGVPETTITDKERAARAFLFNIKKHLINAVKTLKANPEKMPGGEGKRFVTRMEYLLANFDNPEAREAAFQYLIKVEEIEGEGGLSGLGGFFKDLWNGVKDTVKSIGKGIANAAEWTYETTEDTVKHGINAFLKPIGTTIGRDDWGFDSSDFNRQVFRYADETTSDLLKTGANGFYNMGILIGQDDWGYSDDEFNRQVFRYVNETSSDALKYMVNANLVPIGAIAGKELGYSDGDFHRDLLKWANEKTQKYGPVVADVFLSIFGGGSLIKGNPYDQDTPDPAPEEPGPSAPPALDLPSDNKKLMMAGGIGLLLLLLLGAGGKLPTADTNAQKAKKPGQKPKAKQTKEPAKTKKAPKK